MKQKKCVICGKKFTPDSENQYACIKCIKIFKIGMENTIGMENSKGYQYDPPGPAPEAGPSVKFVITPEKKGIYTAFSQDHEITNDFEPTKGISKK